ncbi:hypothetical protein ACWKSP_14405 [Micromonosporaceae bacterium Da 78-11]
MSPAFTAPYGNNRLVNGNAEAADVDAGVVGYSLNGWLGGYLSQTDYAKVVITFRNSGGTSLGTAQIGPVTPPTAATSPVCCNAPRPAACRPAPGASPSPSPPLRTAAPTTTGTPTTSRSSSASSRGTTPTCRPASPSP